MPQIGPKRRKPGQMPLHSRDVKSPWWIPFGVLVSLKAFELRLFEKMNDANDRDCDFDLADVGMVPFKLQ